MSHSALPVHSHPHPTLESKESLCAKEDAEKTGQAGRQASKQAGRQQNRWSVIFVYNCLLPLPPPRLPRTGSGMGTSPFSFSVVGATGCRLEGGLNPFTPCMLMEEWYNWKYSVPVFFWLILSCSLHMKIWKPDPYCSHYIISASRIPEIRLHASFRLTF